MSIFNGQYKKSPEQRNQVTAITGIISCGENNTAIALYDPTKGFLMIETDKLTPTTIHLDGYKIDKRSPENGPEEITFTLPNFRPEIVMTVIPNLN